VFGELEIRGPEKSRGDFPEIAASGAGVSCVVGLKEEIVSAGIMGVAGAAAVAPQSA